MNTLHMSKPSIKKARAAIDQEDHGLPHDICRCLGGDDTHGQCPRIATCHRATYPAGPRSPWMARVCEPHEYDAYIEQGE